MQNLVLIFTFSVLDKKDLFLADFIQSCLFKVKFGCQTNSNMQNTMMSLLFCFRSENFFALDQNTFFKKTWYKNSKFFVQSEIWYLNEFEYGKSVVDIHVFCFGPELSFFCKFLSNELKLSALAKNFTTWKVSVLEVFLVRIQSECGKIRTRRTPNKDTFYAVLRTETNSNVLN